LEELLPEVVPDEAVDEEVCAGAEDTRKVTHMSQTLDPFTGMERMTHIPSEEQIVTLHDALHKRELPDVDNHSWDVTTGKDNHDAEENQEHVRLLPKLPLGTESLGFHLFELQNDPCIDDNEHNEGDDCGGKQSEIGFVELDIVAVLPKLCRPDEGNPLLHVQIYFLRPVEMFPSMFSLPFDFSLEELGYVEDEAEQEDGENVEPGLAIVWRIVERVTDTQEPLDGDGHCHENCCVHCDVGEGINKMWKGHDEHIVL